MDGNNRYGKKNHLATGEGHRVGKNQLDPIVEHCREIGIEALTVFAFSSENWNRPEQEVALLMVLLEEAIHEQMPRMEKYNIALRFIGDRSKVSAKLRQLMLEAEQTTAHHTAMTLTIAMSYGGMWDIAQAAQQIAIKVQAGLVQPDQIDANLFNHYTCLSDLPPVDVLIRTGGDYRLSNFLIWQSAYAELFFTETLWPDFTIREFDQILQSFAHRERRFGKTSEQVQSLKTMQEN
ncbi:di-trans,poly-cis-decaprenylcistransferase [Acinetobacter qingfengensis]|uniref:Ditrans,polycis-undecaprenyl-diphosphate synthase ((2E,6E)-farnesyl-diphosphate specific) n=2 Tax=Acinetobacter qingfengensis TaxID=1262585 RepID=A0A1E7RE36_9GAMM|nr:di-trans,poly-cis-decaprenylcistransferase [Acinetobacter qingfengensis]